MLSNKKAFTMLEMLMSLVIISSLCLISLNNFKEINDEYLTFMNDYLLNQSESLKERVANYLSKGISFNSMGHVNLARTIDFENHKVIIHLGNGYLTYE